MCPAGHRFCPKSPVELVALDFYELGNEVQSTKQNSGSLSHLCICIPFEWCTHTHTHAFICNNLRYFSCDDIFAKSLVDVTMICDDVHVSCLN